jgi:hypothetical protein
VKHKKPRIPFHLHLLKPRQPLRPLCLLCPTLLSSNRIRLLRGIKHQICKRSNFRLLLERNSENTLCTRNKTSGGFRSYSTFGVGHRDNSGVSPATIAGAAGSHCIALEAVEDVLLVDEAAPVGANGVETAWGDDLVEGEDADLGVVFNFI